MSRARSLLFWTAGVIGAPLLALQAAAARARAPRLPPADGEREGRVDGPAPELRLAVLGDSTAVGVGVERARDGLARKVAEEIAAREARAVRWRAIGAPGARAAHVVERVASLPATDVAVITVGVNDVTGLTHVDRWREDVQRLVDRLAERGVDRIVFAGVPPMGSFPALPRPLRDWLGVRAAMLDDALGEVVTDLRGVRRLRFTGPVRPEGMAPDGYHPGAEGYAGWARALARLAREEPGPGARKGSAAPGDDRA